MREVQVGLVDALASLSCTSPPHAARAKLATL